MSIFIFLKYHHRESVLPGHRLVALVIDFDITHSQAEAIVNKAEAQNIIEEQILLEEINEEKLPEEELIESIEVPVERQELTGLDEEIPEPELKIEPEIEMEEIDFD